MCHHRSEEERLRLGERAAYLRNVKGLLWRQITERLGVGSIRQAVIYYKKYKAAKKAEKERMSLEQVEEFASCHGILSPWVWLFENGFEHRVPEEVQDQIERAKRGRVSFSKEVRC